MVRALGTSVKTMRESSTFQYLKGATGKHVILGKGAMALN